MAGAVLPAFATGAVDLGLEGVEVLLPVRSQAGDPGLDLSQWTEIGLVDALPTDQLRVHETGLSQHPQVPADGRPTDLVEPLGDAARRQRTGGEQFDDAAAHGIGEHVVQVHG